MMNLPLAFLLGCLGSVHCAVMCGPLMLSLPVQKRSWWREAFSLFQYQLGRILMYTLLGLAAGLLGSGVRAFAGQEQLSLAIGMLMVVFTLFYFAGKRANFMERFNARLIHPISKAMGRWYTHPLWGFIAGVLNGLIPCGMVYLALATALTSGTVKDSAAFMLLFGVGTVPMMLAISLGGIYLKRYIRFNPRRLIPWFTLFLGALFILRAANLDIPFLSPGHDHRFQGSTAECR